MGVTINPEFQTEFQTLTLGRPKSEKIQTLSFITPLHHNNFVKAIINNIHVKILIDSGVSICVLNLYWNGWCQSEITTKSVRHNNIYGVGGEIQSTISKCHLTIKIQVQTFAHPFDMFNKLHCSLIIGMDWLKHFKASIDIAHSKLLHDRTFSTDLETQTHIGLLSRNS